MLTGLYPLCIYKTNIELMQKTNYVTAYKIRFGRSSKDVDKNFKMDNIQNPYSFTKMPNACMGG